MLSVVFSFRPAAHVRALELRVSQQWLLHSRHLFRAQERLFDHLASLSGYSHVIGMDIAGKVNELF